MTETIGVAVIGAGHAGLCVVEALQRRGVKPTVFDHADRLGDVWRRRYDELVLNTRGDASAGPGGGVDESPIELWHSSEFTNPAPLHGRRVLVIGAGNSGVEIAHLCAADGVDTTLSMEKRPVFARREFFGTDLTAAARHAKRLPDRVVDLSGRALQFLLFGRLGKWGLGPPEMRLSNVSEASGATLDSGFIDDVKAGRITVTDAVDHFDGDHVVTRSGLRIAADVVIAATGYSPALDEMLPADGLDEGWPLARTAPWSSAPGLYTAGLNPATLTAFHPDFIVEADEIAADIVALEVRRKQGVGR